MRGEVKEEHITGGGRDQKGMLSFQVHGQKSMPFQGKHSEREWSPGPREAFPPKREAFPPKGSFPWSPCVAYDRESNDCSRCSEFRTHFSGPGLADSIDRRERHSLPV